MVKIVCNCKVQLMTPAHNVVELRILIFSPETEINLHKCENKSYNSKARAYHLRLCFAIYVFFGR
jgi:hypothetical protein